MYLPKETLGLRREGFSPSLTLLIPAFSLVWADTAPFGTACISHTTLAYRVTKVTPIASVVCLSPGHFRHRHARPVSCYALFKWWLLLSQHPGCFRTTTTFSTEHTLGTLADGLGCSPLDYEDYPPQSESRDYTHGIRSLIGFGSPVRPLAQSVLYPHTLQHEPIPLYISVRTRYLQV